MTTENLCLTSEGTYGAEPPSGSFTNDDGDEFIFDDDTDEESDMFDDQDWVGDEDIEIKDVVDGIPKSSSVSDPYEIVYSNIP
ncbi:hypothetical protein E2562_004106 [Oryza meyeriana var. granulata]|uniref:Uncharacterized protein n=1 Tax=Oryza meyeriana var. granulata TaxID=110450 RepID=A0A6G1EV31_9ORYZ|nr:hypothetical protein E2562_004106 [Oryza meyeriana var. granulata]